MKTLPRLFVPLLLSVLCAQAQTGIKDPKISGTGGQVVNGGTLTVANGATLVIASGGTIIAEEGSTVTGFGSGGGGTGEGTPGGSNTQVQFNDSGSFAGDSGMTWNKTTNTLTITGGIVVPVGTFSGQLTSTLSTGTAPFVIASTTRVANLNVATAGTADAVDLSGIGSLGTGVGTALGTNVGSAGAFVVNGGALGTPASGVGTNLTGLNADNLGTGIVPDARFPVTLPAISGANLTNLNASNLASGTLPDGRFPATLPAVSGANLTGTASSLTAGAATALATARTIGGSSFDGTANVTSFPSPGAIGGSTPASGAFTTLSSNTQIIASQNPLVGSLDLTGVGPMVVVGKDDGSLGEFAVRTYNGGAPQFAGRSANGGLATALSATTSGQALVRITGNGYGATGYVPGNIFGIFANQNFTDSAAGANFQIQLVQNGTTSRQTYLTVGGVDTAGLLFKSGLTFTASTNDNIYYTAYTPTITSAGTSTDIRTLNVEPTLTGSTGAAALRAARLRPVFSGSAALTTLESSVSNLVHGGSATVTTALGHDVSLGLTSTGSVTNYTGFQVGSTTASSSGDVTGTITGYNVSSGASRSAATNFIGFNVSAQTNPAGTLHVAYRGQIASATGRYNLYMDGTAANLLAGATSITDTTASSSTTTGALIVSGGAGFAKTVYFPAATTSIASFNMAHGTAPSSPNNGDTWTTTGGVFVRVNGVTKNLLKPLQEIQLNFPHQVDNTGATRVTSEGATYGHATFSNSAAKTGNYVLYRLRVPADLDTTVDLTATFSFRLGNTDTGKHAYEISMADVADSAGADSPTFSNAIALNFAGDASGASGDVETITGTLTSWRSSLTAGHLLVIKLARAGDDGTNDTSTVNSTDVNLTIKYANTQ